MPHKELLLIPVSLLTLADQRYPPFTTSRDYKYITLQLGFCTLSYKLTVLTVTLHFAKPQENVYIKY